MCELKDANLMKSIMSPVNDRGLSVLITLWKHWERIKPELLIMSALTPVDFHMTIGLRFYSDLHFKSYFFELKHCFSFALDALLKKKVAILNIKANMAECRYLEWDIFLWLVLPFSHVLRLDVLSNKLVLSPVKEHDSGSFSHLLIIRINYSFLYERVYSVARSNHL